MKNYLRGFLPVVIDVETGGFNETTDALLEIAAVFIDIDKQRFLYPQASVRWAIKPFPGSNLEHSSLEINCIDPFDPLRNAQPEKEVLKELFLKIHDSLKKNECTRAIIVAHNAQFDLKFLNAAVQRTGIKNNPFHAFSSIDTVTLGALAYGQTVLARVAEAAGLRWDNTKAHSADYDANITAHILCKVFNRWRQLECKET